MIDYKEIGDFIENKVKDPQKTYNQQQAIITDECVHHPDKMTDKECMAYAKAMVLNYEIRDTDKEAADFKKELAKQCLDRKPNDDQLATLIVASQIYSDIDENQFLPPFYALYKNDLLGEYQNSCSIITAMAKYEEYSRKIFGEGSSSTAINTLKRMLDINYQQSTIAADNDFFDKKRPYHLSDIKTSLILDQLGKIVDKDYYREYNVSEILHDLAAKESFQAAANRHPALAVSFTKVGEKCIEAAAKRKEHEIFEGYGKRLRLLAKDYQKTAESPRPATHVR